MTRFQAPISEMIWDKKYRFRDPINGVIDQTVEDTWRRVARTLASAEKAGVRERWFGKFYAVMQDFRFLPAGRIIAGAGTERRVTLFNCFTMGTIPDSMDGIFSHLKEAALTMQQGGGIGYDFSTLRPKGALVKQVGADASGPLSFMDCWDAMCRTVMSAGSRRGAMMATMRCDHPDIEDFIAAKADPAKLRMFNLSVLVTDEFMEAVKAGSPWRLHFENRTGETLLEKTVDARELWDKIMKATYAYAEPGVIFIDRVNKLHNIGYSETVATTNPCGEKPMGPYAACLLGSMNLTAYIVPDESGFGGGFAFDGKRFSEDVHTAIRMMDNVIEVSNFPLPQQAEKAKQDRQLGLGITGLGSSLAMLGIVYGSDDAVRFTRDVMKRLTLESYRASIELAKEKGPFPGLVREAFLRPNTFAGSKLPKTMQDDILKHGIRNALLTSIAPTGTISLYANNVSSGIEPIFALSYTRKVLQNDGSKIEETVEDFSVAAHRGLYGEGDLPRAYVTAQTLSPEDHVRMQAAAQEWTDSSISKTVNVPKDISFEDFVAVYQLAYDLGCKGCTTYRPNDITGSVLEVKEEPKASNGGPELDFADSRAEGMEPRDPEIDKLVGETHVMLLDTDGNMILDGNADGFEIEFWPEGDGQTVSGILTDLTLAPPQRILRPVEAAPQERPDSLPGEVYKLKWPGSDHAIYVTVTDIVDPDSGQRRPFEVFINSKNMEHFAWTVALTRMISAIFRRPHDSRFVVEELKAVFDPKGGAWIGGKYVPSVLAAIGDVIERHMKAIGYIETTFIKPQSMGKSTDAPLPGLAELFRHESSDKAQLRALGASTGLAMPDNTTGLAPVPPGPSCPSCGSYSVKHEAGCLTCLDCGFSKCG